MSGVLRVALFVFLLCSFVAQAGCGFRPELRGVHSLSGPVTVGLKHLGLLSDPKLKGISIFHPVGNDEFKGQVHPGGVFLGKATLQAFKGMVLFYDESRELSKIIQSMSMIHGREFSSRGLTPLEVTEAVIRQLMPFLSGCEDRLASFRKAAELKSKELLASLPKDYSAVFYLGEYRRERPPELIMVNDGVVKWLLIQKKLRTYPSELSYVSWSSKIMKELPAMTIHVGIRDSGRLLTKKVTRGSGKEVNLTYPGALVPGISQVEAWSYLTEAP